MKAQWTLLAMLALTSCDAPRAPVTSTNAGTTTAHPEARPFSIDPILWGATTVSATYEIRQMPDGSPGLFSAEGALLLDLLPELIVDAGPAGKGRPKPTRRRFELVKLTASPVGGFTLLARLKDDNGIFDLRVENGPHDPRVHVGLATKWQRDVTVNREVIAFRTGPFDRALALRHDFEWVDAGEEWVSPAHAPNVARFGADALTAMGRFGTENLVLRRADDRWIVEIEAYHFENHPLEVGDGCDEVLDGAATFSAGSRSELRADFIVGAAELPFAQRFPAGRRGAVSLAEGGDPAHALAAAPETPPAVVPIAHTWIGPSLADVSCESGRFKFLTERGTTAMWSGTAAPLEEGNAFAPTEADARRVWAFTHPNAPISAIFTLPSEPADRQMLSPEALAGLKSVWGLAVGRAELEPLLASDASAMKTVRETLTDVDRDGTIWIAEPGAVARRLVAMSAIDFEFLPGGVVRVRNGSEIALDGVTLALPDGVKAKLPTSSVHAASGQLVWFDLPVAGEQLLQLFRGEDAAWTMRPADITVSYQTSDSP